MATILKDFSDATTALVQSAAEHVVAVHGHDWRGSSGIILKPGVAVTAEEALDSDDDIEITLPGNRRVKATVAGRDASTDVAVLKYEGSGAAAELEPSTPQAGSLVVAVGRVAGGPVATLGTIAHVGEAWRSSQGGLIDALIRVDVTLARAAEGGALVDGEGRLIGMAVFGPRRRVLAIPLSTVKRAADEILAHGTVSRGYIGVSVQPVNVGEDRGAIVVGLDPDGPAKKAGLMLGDIVLTWNGERVKGTRAITDRLGPPSVGTNVALGLSRAGQDIQLSLTVASRPSA